VEYGLKNLPLPEDYSFRTESEALRSALDEVVPDVPVDVAAWSFGAAVALTYVLDHPERIRTLTLIEPPAFWVLDSPPQDPGFEGLRRSSEETRTDVDEDGLESFVRLVGISPPNVDPKRMPQWPTWMKYRRSLRANIVPFEFRDDPGRLDDFQPPVLLVKGTGSAPFLHAVIDTLGRRLPNSETVEYPAGHAPHIVSMERFLDKMTSFQAQKGRVEVTAGGSSARP
jgi:pimeloyl-ACP methyl ester carboxylesterase